MNKLSLHPNGSTRSVRLLDQNEELKVENIDELCTFLGVEANLECKVISILGNTGEGKSYTLNHTLFDGEDVFGTSSRQDSCTLGVDAAFQPEHQLLVLDTEGMMGASLNATRRRRLLLKVLAWSDLVIYRTKAERLHNDLFNFLGDASRSYDEHFSEALRKTSGEDATVMGPVVIISHDTRHTAPFQDDSSGTGPTYAKLQDRFRQLNQSCSSFKKLLYLGSTAGDSRSSFERLKEVVIKESQDCTTRIRRPLHSIFQAIQTLNDAYLDDLPALTHKAFSDKYFVCQVHCECCNAKCQLQLKHEDNHKSQDNCIYHKAKDNRVSYCMKCYQGGKRTQVVPKCSGSSDSLFVGLAINMWSGDVLECPWHGIIYRSRENWVNNQEPENKGVIHVEICHLWPGERAPQGTQNAARRVLDGVSNIGEYVSTATAEPTRAFTSYIADQVAPQYWQLNAEAKDCNGCKNRFSSTDGKHHCRKCGLVFCGPCSDYQCPAPERGWGEEPQKACKKCYLQSKNGNMTASSCPSEPVEGNQARKVTEKAIGALSVLGSAIAPVVGALKETARPDYWEKDEYCKNCRVCVKLLADHGGIHHCRDCGFGVCDSCSLTRRPVPHRGWDQPQRVCDNCLKKPSYLTS